MRSRAPGLAAGTRLVLFVGLAARSWLPVVPLTIAVAVGSILLRRLVRRRLCTRLPGTTAVSDTKTGGRSSTIVPCVSKSRLVVLIALGLLGVGNLSRLDNAIDLSLLRRVESVEVLRRRRRAQLSDRREKWGSAQRKTVDDGLVLRRSVAVGCRRQSLI